MQNFYPFVQGMGIAEVRLIEGQSLLNIVDVVGLGLDLFYYRQGATNFKNDMFCFIFVLVCFYLFEFG